MPFDNVEARVKTVVADQLDKKTEDLTLETRFAEDLGADSLDAAEIIMQVEEEFGDITIPDEVSNKMKTIGDVVVYIKNLL